MTEPQPTTERLAAALEAAAAPLEMIERAREGYYDDYKSPLATPCVQLVNDLHELGLAELRDRAINGEFDGTPQESAAWFESEGKEYLPQSMWGLFSDQPKREKPKGFGK